MTFDKLLFFIWFLTNIVAGFIFTVNFLVLCICIYSKILHEDVKREILLSHSEAILNV